LRLDLHAGGGSADAACRQHALAFDLHHADAAVAVGAVAGLGRVAQMRQLDAEAARGAGDGLAGADVGLAIGDGEGDGLVARVGTHASILTPTVVPARGTPRHLCRGDPVAETHRATHAGLWNMGPRFRGDDTCMGGSIFITNSRAASPAPPGNT